MKQHHVNNHSHGPKLTLASLAQECATRFETIENGMTALMEGQARMMALATEQQQPRPTSDEVATAAARVEAIVKDVNAAEETIDDALKDVSVLAKQSTATIQQQAAPTIQSVMAWLPTATKAELKTLRQWLAGEALGTARAAKSAVTTAAVKTTTAKPKTQGYRVAKLDANGNFMKWCGSVRQGYADAEAWMLGWSTKMNGASSYVVRPV